MTNGRDKWNMIISAQKRALVFKKRALRQISGPKRDTLAGRMMMHLSEEIRRLNEHPLITIVIKARRLQASHALPIA